MIHTRINLSALRSGQLPRLMARKSGGKPPTLNWEDLRVTRRNMLGVAAFAGLSVNPAVKMLNRLAYAAEEPFSYEVTETRIAFTCGGRERWVVDTRAFGGTPRLTSLRESGRFLIQMSGATFPGTSLPADFVCDLRRAPLSWSMRLFFSLGQFQAQVPFERWLMGQERAFSRIRLHSSVCRMGLDGHLQLVGSGSAWFTPDWQFQLTGANLGCFHGQEIDAVSDTVRVALLNRSAPSLAIRPGSATTLLAMDRGPHRWFFTPAFRADSSGRLVYQQNAFQTLHLEAWEESDDTPVCALLAEGNEDDASIWFHPEVSNAGTLEEPLAFPLTKPQYVRVFHPKESLRHQALRAEFSPDPVSVKLLGCRLEVGGQPTTCPAFELIQHDDGTETCCEPTLARVAVPLAGALVEPIELPHGTRLVWSRRNGNQLGSEHGNPWVVRPTATGSSKKKPLPRLQLPPPQKAPAPAMPMPRPAQPSGKAEPVMPSTVVVVTDFRSLLQVQGPFTVAVVRPEDLLVLKFEFRGWVLQVAPGQPPKVVRAGGQTHAILVHFPPQHIAEQAFFETQDPNAPRHEKVTFPIKAQIAGWSRLAFDVPSQISEIPYTLEALLNWAQLIPVVAPSAAPPPPPPRRILMKAPRLFDRAGRLKVSPVMPREVPSEEQGIPQSFPLPPSPPSLRWLEVRGPAASFARARVIFGRAKVDPIIQVAGRQQVRPGRPQVPPPQAIAPNIVRVPPSPPRKQDLPQITAIEAPFRLFLSPSQQGGWAHAVKPVALNNRMELWHSRLGVRKQDQQGQWGVDESNEWHRTLRAIWSPDYNPDPKKGPDLFRNKSKPDDVTPFRMLPEARDRHELVHLMANALNFPEGWQNRYAKVERFMLSSLGAWMNLRYAYEPAPNSFNVVEWKHIANMARDQFVKIVKEGFLYPFGHKAALVQITERKFEKTSKGIAAVLRYYEYIVVREPVKDYPGPGQESLTFSRGRNFAYRQLSITTPVTPKLDPSSNIGGVPTTMIAFWPRVSQQDFQWHLVGEDWAGQTSEFSVPLIFMTKDVGLSADRGRMPPIKIVRNEYFKAPPLRRTADLGGQKVAFAPPKPGGDTVLETTSLTFDAEIPCDVLAIQEGFLPACSAQVIDPLKKASDPLFYPLVREAEVSVPAIKSLVGTGPAADRTKVRYSNLYRVNGFAGPNQGELFLELLEPVGLRFGQTDKVGGVGAPNLDIVGISRTFGPVGGGGSGVKPRGLESTADKFAKGQFDPKDFFKDAKILGGIDLADIIGAATSLAAGKAPKLLTDRLPEALHTRFELTVQPVNAAIFVAKLPSPVNKKASLVLKALIKVKLPSATDGSPAPPEPEFNAEGELQNFQLDIFKQLILSFKKFRFVKAHGKKVDVSVELTDEQRDGIKGVQFGGALAFLAKLQELIPSQGLSDPPNIEVTPTGVKAGVSVAIPAVTVGALSLTNMKFGAFLLLPFTGDPVNLRVQFSSRNDPFMGAVWIFGLTGFFAVEMNGKEGLALVEVQIEFGGMWAFDIGIASGGVKLVAGIYFKYEVAEGVFLEGYIKVHGAVQVLGIASISLMFKLALQYSSVADKVWGEASVELKVEVLFFEVSVGWTCRKELAGSGHSSGTAWQFDEEEPLVRLASDDGWPYRTQRPQPELRVVAQPRLKVRAPKINEMMTVSDWNQYSGAFAADAA